MIFNVFLPPCGFCAVCGPSNLPAGAVIYLVWTPGGMERQPHGLEAVGLRGDLPHHAFSLHGLLARTQIEGAEIGLCRESFPTVMRGVPWP